MKHHLLAFLAVPAVCGAWDSAGHMLVGQIAWRHMTPAAREKATELVAMIDGKFNGGKPYNFVTVGCWMDDLRELPRKEYPWSKWHYVDGEKTADGSAFKLPEPPHVVWAIEQNIATLKDPGSTKEKRAEALGQLIHWVGDVHQPLHATTWNNDRGGNGYLIFGVPFSDLIVGQSSNLHTYWDKAFRFDSAEGKIVEAWKAPAERPSEPGEGIIAQRANEIDAAISPGIASELKNAVGAEAWAKESHVIGCIKAYPPGEHPNEIEVRKLDAEWVAGTRKIAEQRIVVAGHRLANLLNETLK
jgi:hypothetical protein